MPTTDDFNIVYIAAFYGVLCLLIYWKLKQPLDLDTSRCIDVSSVKIKRYMVLLMALFVFAIFASVSGGFLAHQDTAWHQIAPRADDERIPTRLIIYNIFYPAYLVIGGSIAFYAKTRLTNGEFDGRFKIALVCNSLAPFMFLPSQDPEMMTFSTDLLNIVFRAAYWLMMLMWIVSLLEFTS
ncbi:MAG: hypothetical protein A6F71_03195 [Cycloclasticus sp. symbiont of Poecilosclerida sp. M]|nr:MAG: hypothetical protein A6F71_03195 [Cycloclasticus sp. symbiont of Poecilosclerida sp. M]